MKLTISSVQTFHEHGLGCSMYNCVSIFKSPLVFDTEGNLTPHYFCTLFIIRFCNSVPKVCLGSYNVLRYLAALTLGSAFCENFSLEQGLTSALFDTGVERMLDAVLIYCFL